MNRPGPALRAGAAAVAATLAGFAVIGGLLEWRLHRYDEGRDRATATAVGTVVEDGIGDGGDVRVRWTDAGGNQREQRFGIYDTDRYVTGTAFRVAYDPTRPAAAGYPAEPDETAGEDDITVPQELAGLAAALLLLVWVGRGLLYRLAARRPAQPATATVLAGETGGPLGSSSWLRLADPDGFVADRWQRVMWHPALDEAAGPLPVVVHGTLAGRRRVVAELADGTRTVPVGRLRRRPPARDELDERRHVRSSIADAVILPAGALPPVRSRWRAGLLVAGVGAGVGAGLGLFVAGPGPTGLVCSAAAAAVLLLNVWALAGANP